MAGQLPLLVLLCRSFETLGFTAVSHLKTWFVNSHACGKKQCQKNPAELLPRPVASITENVGVLWGVHEQLQETQSETERPAAAAEQGTARFCTSLISSAAFSRRCW